MRTLLALSGASLLAACPAPAQSGDLPTPLLLDPIAVTGTRLERPLAEAPVPVTVIDRAEIERRAPGNLSELLRELPELAATGITENVAINFTHGTTALNLRGLGTTNTLILVDGRRVTNSGSAFDDTLFVDLNRYPPGMIERVEILKGGASAVYGADAVAGVINLITRRRREGGELFVSHGNAFDTDAAETHVSLLAGATRGRLALTARASFFDRHALASRDRYFSRTANLVPRFTATEAYYAALPAAQQAAFDGRSITGPSARISVAAGQINGQNGVNIPGLAAGAAITALPGTGGSASGTQASATPGFTAPFLQGTGGQFSATAAASFQAPELTRGDPNARNLYNFNEVFGLVPAATRAGAGLRLDYETAAGPAAFLDVSGQRNRSRIDLLAVGISTVVPRTNFYNPFGVDVNVAWRPVETGPRRSLVESTNLALLAGLRSAANADTPWEIAASHGRDAYSDTMANWLSASKTLAALARTDATALNPFGGPAFRHDAALLESLKVNLRASGRASLTGFDGKVGHELATLPGGALHGVLYAEHRRETYGFGWDTASLTGDILGRGLVPTPSDWAREVNALAAEVRAPLLAPAGAGGPPRLALEASARLERADGGFDSGVRPAAGLVANPGRGLTLRASWADTFRAPGLVQLFSPQSEGYYNSVPDPRRPVALTGDLYDGPNVSRLVRTGGNPALRPELGRVIQAGATWAPTAGALAGLALEATWFRYDINDLIAGVSPAYVLDNELGGLGDLVHRDAGAETYTNTTTAPITVLTGPAGATTLVAPGQSAAVPGRLQRIDSYTVNLSRRRLIGADFGVRYARELAPLGRWTLDASATYTQENSYAYDLNQPLVDGTGRNGSPSWRGRFTADWERGIWQAGATLLYTPSSGGFATDGAYTKPYRVLHLSGGWRAPRDSWLRGTRVQLGVDDVLNAEPPLHNDPPIGYNYGSIARPQGRFWRVSLKREW
jgi:iron complex outermembrane receptor protein